MTNEQHDLLDELTRRIEELGPQHQEFVRGLAVYSREMPLSGRQVLQLETAAQSLKPI